MKNIRQFKLKPCYLAISSLIIGLNSGNVYSAESKEKEVEVIEVIATGYANSLALALANKRESSGTVDSILAEDIADFPDQNLADSLQRIPGVAITRDGGEGKEITVRGLNGTFSRILLNGMETQSIAGGRTNRNFDFNTFASELFNRLEVHKTTNAKMVEGSLGATVGLYTARPFDYKDDVFAVNAQAAYNSASSDTTPRLSAVYSFTNDDDSLGFVVSGAYSQRSVYVSGPQTGRWEDDRLSTCTACVDSDPENQPEGGYWHPRFPRYVGTQTDVERTGITTSIQWIPSDDTLITVDGLFSNTTEDKYSPTLTPIGLARTGDTGLQQSDWSKLDSISSTDTLTVGTIRNTDIRSETGQDYNESDFNQVTITVEQIVNDEFSFDVLIGSSRSEATNLSYNLIFEHYSDNDSRKNITYAENSSDVSWNFSDQLNPVIDYSFDLNNPANWETSELRWGTNYATSETDTAKIDFEYLLSDEIILTFGYNTKSYSFDRYNVRRNAAFNSVDGEDGTVDQTACGISAAVTSSDGQVYDREDVFFGATQEQIFKVRDSGCFPEYENASDDRKVLEEVDAYYAQVDFETEISNMILRGNAGVREAKTNLTTTGIQQTTELIEVTVKHEYSDTLPSVNLALEATDDLLFRFGWAQVMARPDLGNLTPGGSVTTFGVPGVSYGNPFIEPYRADTLDLSAEWYFDEGALLSIAYFQKDIESFPEAKTDDVLWANTGLPDSLLGVQYDDLKDETFAVKRTVNGIGGDLDGIEIQYQQNLDFLPGPEWMTKFGVLTNVTFVNSEVTRGFDDDNNPILGPLTGQSDESANFTLYWEDDVFSARISAAYRGEWYSNINNDAEKSRVMEETTNVDFSASYQLNENLRLSFEAINLTDELVNQWMGFGERLIDSYASGRQFHIGMSYKM